MFQRLTFNGQPIPDDVAMTLLDVTAEYSLPSHEHMYGKGRRPVPEIALARAEAWARLSPRYKQAQLARIFGVSRAAVNLALKRRASRPDVCPCCGRGYD